MRGSFDMRGRSNKIVGQTGEYLVAAELSRRGLIATTFTGNVPYYDIIASNDIGKHVSVQVKASKTGSWQFSYVTDFCDVEVEGKRQIIGRKKKCPVENLIMVFVVVSEGRGDRYYVLSWEDLRDIVVKHHKEYLKKHNGVRPRNHRSLHVGVKEVYLAAHNEKWEVVENKLR